jgi:class 3 adenylate cyclase
MVPWIADRAAVLEGLVSFLTSGEYISGVHSDDELRTVVFTDLVSSTEVLNRLGDAEGRSAFRSVEQTVSELCASHHGRLVKNLGDGSLISFKSTQHALAFAIELQHKMETSPLAMRIGMAAGELIQEDGDIHGAVVVQASRIADLGDPGEIVVADTVRQLAIGKGFNFEDVGELVLKGFDEPTSLWRVTE